MPMWERAPRRSRHPAEPGSRHAPQPGFSIFNYGPGSKTAPRISFVREQKRFASRSGIPARRRRGAGSHIHLIRRCVGTRLFQESSQSVARLSRSRRPPTPRISMHGWSFGSSRVFFCLGTSPAERLRLRARARGRGRGRGRRATSNPRPPTPDQRPATSDPKPEI